ncbi:hypothetical protein DK843_04305 [Chromobacterium phragmitis]|uniref:Transposase n=1 Tax=Chromobacterium phragmitis TaxID=2202141 RepID=A0A344UNM2_9NEIS|nr:hypothetical protein DK843_04305 [Chromobacterium phragmitis]
MDQGLVVGFPVGSAVTFRSGLGHAAILPSRRTGGFVQQRHWKKKYGGLGVSELPRLKQLEEENARLKRMVADLSPDKPMLQEVIQKKL